MFRLQADNIVITLVNMIGGINDEIFNALSSHEKNRLESQARFFLSQALRGTQGTVPSALRGYIRHMIAGLMLRLSQAAGPSWNLSQHEFPPGDIATVTLAINTVFGKNAIDTKNLIDNLQCIVAASAHGSVAMREQIAMQQLLDAALIADQQLIANPNLQALMHQLQPLLANSMEYMPRFVAAFFPGIETSTHFFQAPIFSSPALRGGGCWNFKPDATLVEMNSAVTGGEGAQPMRQAGAPPAAQGKNYCSVCCGRLAGLLGRCTTCITIAANYSIKQRLGAGSATVLAILLWTNIAFLVLANKHARRIQEYQDNQGIGGHASLTELYASKGIHLLFYDYDSATGEPSFSGGSLAINIVLMIIMLFYIVVFIYRLIAGNAPLSSQSGYRPIE